MVNKWLITIVIGLVALSLGLWAIVASQTPLTPTAVPGVAVGNVFTYSIKGYAALTAENASIPESFSELNMTEWYRITITNVTGPEVQFNTTWRFTNGTEIENIGNVNVFTGADNKIFWAIYPANLTLNEYVSPGGSDGAIVNQTETRTYKSGDRGTNVMTLQNQFVDTSDPALRTVDDYLYVHFDRATGMLVELKDMRLYSDPEVILTTEQVLISSNVWAVA
jgi:hypothetical protein